MTEHEARHDRNVDAVDGVGRWVLIATAVLLLIGSIGITLVQVTVTVDGDGTTRACGSVLDSLTNRAGWEEWWANDLDEPGGAGRGELTRTTSCPSAVNRMIGSAAALAAIGIVSAVSARGTRRDSPTTTTSRTTSAKVAMMGRFLSGAGLVAGIIGTIGIVALLLDTEAEVFRYVDRTIVGLVGLIILMPAVATFAIGRTLVLMGVPSDPTEDRADA